MTPDSSAINFRLLAAEDDKPTQTQFVKLIKEALPGIHIDAAETVADARELIIGKRKEGILYDLAVLDFKLPSEQGMHPEVDSTICTLLKEDGIPIIHYSGWPKDPKIKTHMDDVHSEDGKYGTPVHLIHKTTTVEGVIQLKQMISAYYQEVINGILRRRLEDVFGTLPPPGERRRTRHRLPVAGGTCGTHALIQLHEDIVKYWSFLNGMLKKQIGEIFAIVDLDGDEKRLSLFPEEGS